LCRLRIHTCEADLLAAGNTSVLLLAFTILVTARVVGQLRGAGVGVVASSGTARAGSLKISTQLQTVHCEFSGGAKSVARVPKISMDLEIKQKLTGSGSIIISGHYRLRLAFLRVGHRISRVRTGQSCHKNLLQRLTTMVHVANSSSNNQFNSTPHNKSNIWST
jgi:hypothetical protein